MPAPSFFDPNDLDLELLLSQHAQRNHDVEDKDEGKGNHQSGKNSPIPDATPFTPQILRPAFGTRSDNRRKGKDES